MQSSAQLCADIAQSKACPNIKNGMAANIDTSVHGTGTTGRIHDNHLSFCYILISGLHTRPYFTTPGPLSSTPKKHIFTQKIPRRVLAGAFTNRWFLAGQGTVDHITSSRKYVAFTLLSCSASLAIQASSVWATSSRLRHSAAWGFTSFSSQGAISVWEQAPSMR